MDKETTLQKFGLNEKEAKIYLAILELGPSTIKPLADRANIKRTSIYYFIDRLVELGLISKFKKNNRMYFHAPSPYQLIEMENERMKFVQNALPELMSLYNQTPHKPKISYFEGPEQMKNIVREEPKCTAEALYIWPGQDVTEMVGGSEFMVEINRQRIEKNVFIKSIRFRDKNVPFETSSQGLENLLEIRWAPKGININIGIGIYDTGKVSFFSSKKENFGILIESHELTGAMQIFHKLLWDMSAPAKIGEG